MLEHGSRLRSEHLPKERCTGARIRRKQESSKQGWVRFRSVRFFAKTGNRTEITVRFGSVRFSIGLHSVQFAFGSVFLGSVSARFSFFFFSSSSSSYPAANRHSILIKSKFKFLIESFKQKQ